MGGMIPSASVVHGQNCLHRDTVLGSLGAMEDYSKLRNMSSLVYRLVHAPVTRESWVRLPGEEIFLECHFNFTMKWALPFGD